MKTRIQLTQRKLFISSSPHYFLILLFHSSFSRQKGKKEQMVKNEDAKGRWNQKNKIGCTLVIPFWKTDERGIRKKLVNIHHRFLILFFPSCVNFTFTFSLQSQLSSFTFSLQSQLSWIPRLKNFNLVPLIFFVLDHKLQIPESFV